MRVYYLGASAETDAGAPFAQRFLAAGYNTGNLLIGHAVARQLRTTAAGRSLEHQPRHVQESFDVVVIPAANFLFEGFDFAWAADFLEKLTLPVVMIGVGAQAPTYDHPVKLQEGTLRLMKIVAERSKSIAVRGHFTASVLEGLGIRNLRVTGCPSMYWTLDPRLQVGKTADPARLRVALNGSRNVLTHSAAPEQARKVERLLIQAARRGGHDYVLQSEMPEIAMVCGESAPEHDAQLGEIVRGLGLACSRADYAAFVRRKGRVFFSIDEWAQYIRGFDFVVGSRFHGNMIALQQGVPAAVLAHDARTRELCELFHIPHLLIADVNRLDLPLLYELASYEALELAYNRLFREYVEFLDENGLPHVLRWAPFAPVGGHVDSYARMASRRSAAATEPEPAESASGPASP